MADTTISSLTQIPSLVGTASLPITDGTTTYRTTITQLTSYNLPIIVATGGTETTITERGIRYRIHTFTTTGTTSLNITTAINNPTVEVLIVAGGGAGSTAHNNAAFTRINGGLGGGGDGGAWYGYPNNLAGENGTNGLGGGGGGGNYGSAPAGGGRGGSGIVIVRYPIY